MHKWVPWLGASMVLAISLTGAALAGAHVALRTADEPAAAARPVIPPAPQLQPFTAHEAAYLDAIADLAGPLRLMRPYETVEHGHAVCLDLAAGRDAVTRAAERDQLPADRAPAAVAAAQRYLCQ